MKYHVIIYFPQEVKDSRCKIFRAELKGLCMSNFDFKIKSSNLQVNKNN